MAVMIGKMTTSDYEADEESRLMCVQRHDEDFGGNHRLKFCAYALDALMNSMQLISMRFEMFLSRMRITVRRPARIETLQVYSAVI